MDDSEAARLEQVAQVLLATARGDFDVRAERSLAGDSWDVLAFLANQTAEEVEHLVGQLSKERHDLQEALVRLNQAKKMAALGEIAGGVAHELNQPLTVMMTLGERLLAHPDQPIESKRRELELIVAAAGRLGRIVASIRSFGRRKTISDERVNLEEPLGAASELMLGGMRESSITLKCGRVPDGKLVIGDEESLTQVFINLLANARDALADLPSGRERTIDVSFREAGETLEARVADTGPGVSSDLVDKVFEPFFTTKPVGKGTGLGLAISYGIVEDHGGRLDYEQGPGGGACFVIRIPLAKDGDGA